MRFLFLYFTCVLFCVLGLASPAPAANATLPDPPRCPVDAPKSYTATVEVSAAEGQVGQPISILVHLFPATPPSGYFVSAMASAVQRPQGPPPDIATGFPEIGIVPRAPGMYRFAVQVTMLTKASCGGVSSWELLRETVEIEVRE
ncbi:MAG: hypothetical protein ACQESV_08850 [Thermodesulfobacteriota bacterium]